MELNITEENYKEKREELVRLNSNMLGLVMRENELKADSYLTKLKKDFKRSFGNKNIYDMPVLTDMSITESELYKFLIRLPKGADLHVHDMALLPAGKLIDFLSFREDFYINADKKSYDLIYAAKKSDKKDGYISLKKALEDGYYTKEELKYNWTVASACDSALNIWDFFETLFDRHGALSSNPEFAKEYYEYTFRYYVNSNIYHIEIHNMLTESLDDSLDYVRAVREAYYAVKKDYPFFTVRIIGAGVKSDNDKIQMTKTCFLNTTLAQELVKDESNKDNITNFVIGFDLVNEEDTSLPLYQFADMLIKAKRRYPDMKLYIHSGESLDANNDNLIDAYLLGVSRVGHGLNLYRYPDLHSRFVKSEICLEVCPISNQVLGYTKDIRNHPATEYLRSGMAIALCSDDPAYMENETLTDDFFAGTVGWDLSLADLKQLGINSIMYSGLQNEEKFSLLKTYNEKWNEFIEETVKNI